MINVGLAQARPNYLDISDSCKVYHSDIYVRWHRMHCNNTTIGTCNAVKTEAIDGGAVENEPSLLQLGEPMATSDVDATE